MTASVFFSSDVANPDTYPHFYCDIQMYTTTMTQPDPETFLLQFVSWEVATKENKWQGRNITRWTSKEADDAFKASQARARSGEARGALHQDQRSRLQRPRGHPGRLPAARAGASEQAARRAAAAGTATSGTCRTGTKRGERAAGLIAPDRDDGRWDAISLKRLLIAIPSLFGISVILFTVLALAPGDPFGELATNPAVPPEVRQALRVKFGLDDPVVVRYFRWIIAMLQGDWGFSFASRINVDTLILQRLPATLLVIGSAQVLALLIALPVGVLAAMRPYSIFDQVASDARRSSASRCRPSSPGSCSSWSSACSSTGCRSSTATSARPAGAGAGSICARRSCRSRCSACSRPPR